MSDALLCSDIECWLRENARGAENAKPRRMLREYLVSQGHSLPPGDPDRFMRRVCAKDEKLRGKIGSCLRGYFWIVTTQDRHVAEGQLVAPAATMFERRRQIKDSAPCGQGELF